MTAVLVEATRGEAVESVHAGVVVVANTAGEVVAGGGDAGQGAYFRSAAKPLQAVPLIESGAAERFRLTDPEIALACASHSGEPAHVDAARAMLAKAECDEGCLACGAHWPLGERASRALAAAGGTAGPAHNNCSGKHAGFICLAVAQGHPVEGYTEPGHPVQEAARAALEDVTGASHADEHRGTDGCSVPSYAIPLTALAFGFARFGTGVGLSPAHAAAAARIRTAVAVEPFMVAGTGRFDTRIMQTLGPRAFVKTGAEGVYAAALPDLGFGIALKCDDGAKRAAEALMAALIRRFLPLGAAERAVVDAAAAPALTNWNGLPTGVLRTVVPLPPAV